MVWTSNWAGEGSYFCQCNIFDHIIIDKNNQVMQLVWRFWWGEARGHRVFTSNAICNVLSNIYLWQLNFKNCWEHCNLPPNGRAKEFIPSLIGYIALKHAQNMLLACNSGCCWPKRNKRSHLKCALPLSAIFGWCWCVALTSKLPHSSDPIITRSASMQSS